MANVGTLLVEGAAGTGKTTFLMTELDALVRSQGLDDGQRVLGLSVMHGSRLRLDQRLRTLASLKRRYACSTFDSLAWRIVSRWRSLARELSLPLSVDYESTCANAATLLKKDEVASWFGRSWPVVVVDEAQDCRGSRLAMLESIHGRVRLLTAGDEFQDLSSEGKNECLAWLRGVSETQTLTTCHRTNRSGLIQAALEVREGRSVTLKGAGFLVLRGQNPSVCASHISRSLAFHGDSDAAILTPTAELDIFDQVQDLVSTKSYRASGKNSRMVGPYPIHREKRPEEVAADILASLELGGHGGGWIRISEVPWRPVPGAAELKAWMERQRRVFGREMVSVDSIKSEIQVISQRLRVSAMSRGSRARSMTIHQAKNREFTNVIVLWPYQVGGSAETMRRALYNAITRARQFATVIVQGRPNDTRLISPPFAP
ncbi:MAG: ATP-dependent helicase [Bacillota bacterium]